MRSPVTASPERDGIGGAHASRDGELEQPRRASISLTEAQLAEVARAVSHPERGVVSLITAFSDLRHTSRLLDAKADGEHVSRSVLRSMLVLAAFPIDGTYREIVKVAREVGFSPSTTHRYVNTWLLLGMLEQDPGSRRYRRTTLATVDGDDRSVPYERSAQLEHDDQSPSGASTRQHRFQRRGAH